MAALEMNALKTRTLPRVYVLAGVRRKTRSPFGAGGVDRALLDGLCVGAVVPEADDHEGLTCLPCGLG